MIIQVSEPHYARDFALIYNSANMLFQEQERCDADEAVFYKQLKEDQNFIYMERETICGFLSFHAFKGYHELTTPVSLSKPSAMRSGRFIFIKSMVINH